MKLFRVRHAQDPAWWGFANASDRDRLEAFLRRAGKSCYQAGLPAVAELCKQADDKLFRALRYNPIHPLHRFLPPKRSRPYLTRGRVHNYVLPSNTTTLDECNFICRLLCKDCFEIIQLA